MASRPEFPTPLTEDTLQGEEEQKKKGRTRVYVSTFYTLIRRRIHEVKNPSYRSRCSSHLKKGQKNGTQGSRQIHASGKTINILDETHKRRKAAKEMNVRYNEEKGIK